VHQNIFTYYIAWSCYLSDGCLCKIKEKKREKTKEEREQEEEEEEEEVETSAEKESNRYGLTGDLVKSCN